MQKLLLFLLATLISAATQAQIVTYDFTGAQGSQDAQPVATKASNVTATALTRTGGTAMSATNTMSFSGLTGNFNLQVGPTTGQSILSSITLSYQRSLDGPSGVSVTSVYVNPAGADYSITPVADGSLTGTSGTITMSFHGRPYCCTPLTSISLPAGYSVRFEFSLGGATSTSATFSLTNQLIVNEANPLPVNLAFFTGEAASNGNNLSWTTSWERNNEGFDILKGQSPTSLEKIGFVKASGTDGVQALTNYSFTDTDVASGQLYYYQLKQRDTDGQFALSQLIAVRAGVDWGTPVIYPNPNQGRFTLTGQNLDPGRVKLYSSSWAEIPIQTKMDGPTILSVAAETNLPSGIYYVKLQEGVNNSALKVIVP